jgi:hypothetical protein
MQHSLIQTKQAPARLSASPAQPMPTGTHPGHQVGSPRLVKRERSLNLNQKEQLVRDSVSMRLDFKRPYFQFD